MSTPSPPAAVRVLLVRHGESTWNADGRWQGQADPPLTDRGRDQARVAVDGLPPLVDLVAASDLERARITAQVLAAAIDREPVAIDPALRERDAGAFSGLTRAEIHERFPGLLPDDPRRDGAVDRDLIPPPGWEPDDDLATRAWRGVDRIARELRDRGGATGVAVTHSGLIYALERHLGLERTRIANLEGRWLEHRDGAWVAGPRHLLLDPTRATITSPDQL